MGVDSEYVAVIGIKKDFYWVSSYKNKNSYLNNNNSDEYKNIVFEDYLPPDFVVYSDGMGCEYSLIGKRIAYPVEYLDEIQDITLSTDDLQNYIDDIYLDFKRLNLKDFVKSDIKLHIFCHFS